MNAHADRLQRKFERAAGVDRKPGQIGYTPVEALKIARHVVEDAKRRPGRYRDPNWHKVLKDSQNLLQAFASRLEGELGSTPLSLSQNEVSHGGR